MKVMIKFLKPSSIIALPLQENVYTKSVPSSEFTYEFQDILLFPPEVEGKDEDEAEEELEKWEDIRHDFIYALYEACSFKKSSTRFASDTVERTLKEGHVLIVSTDASNKVIGFAILRAINNDTYLDLFCANVPGEAAKIMGKVEELARKEGHKHITADAIDKKLVEYYTRYGFVSKPIPETYKYYVENNYIEKQLGGRRVTKRRKVFSRRRRLHK